MLLSLHCHIYFVDFQCDVPQDSLPFGYAKTYAEGMLGAALYKKMFLRCAQDVFFSYYN